MDEYYKRNMTIYEKLYLAQVNNEECFNQVIDLYKKHGETFIDLVKKTRSTLQPWSEANNKTSLSKKDITLYSEDQLIPSPDGYLFDFGDIDYLTLKKINPYTGNKFPIKFISDLTKLKNDRKYFIRIYPLDLSLKGFVDPDTWCPDVRFMNVKTSNTCYISNPLKPINFKKKNAQYKASLFYDKRPWNENYVYKVILNESTKINGLNPYFENIDVDNNEIKSIELIHDPTQFSRPFEGKPVMPLTDDMIKAIMGYHSTTDGKKRYIRPSMIQEFKKNKFHEQTSLKLYRGLQLNTNLFFNNLEKVKVGDVIHLPSQQVSSWTTNRCVAEKYSMFSSGNGIVVSSVIEPKDMILDSRFIRQEDYAKYNHKDNNTLFWQYQNEILVKPGDYPLKIESILYRNAIEHVPYTRLHNEQYRADLIQGWDQYIVPRKPTAKPRNIKKSVVRKPRQKKSVVRKPQQKKSVVRKPRQVSKKSIKRQYNKRK